MDDILKKMSKVQWTYADKDPISLFTLEHKIAETGKKQQLITYSKLVGGVTFYLPNIRNGEAYKINTIQWSGLDRSMIGEYLGYISMRSYKKAGFMASALVVSNAEMTPSTHFFEWMATVGILTDLEEKTVLKFWAEQVKKAHHWYHLNG